MIKQRFSIEGMHCTGCVMAVEGAIERLEGVAVANANYARQVADVEYDEVQVNPEDIVAAVRLAGYDATVNTSA